MDNDFFNFEEDALDFPFYNGKPSVSATGWLLLVIGALLYVGFCLELWNYVPGVENWPIFTTPIVGVLVLLLPLAFCSRGKLGLVIKMPKLKDMKVVILCVIGYIVFTIAMILILGAFGIVGNGNPMSSAAASAPLLVMLILFISLFAEELFKVIAMLLGMTVFYSFTKNRKNSMILAIVFSCIIFGLIHLTTYNFNIMQCLLIIGCGAVFHLYPYIKTKNVINSYITHVLIDFLLFLPVMLMGAG